MTPISRRLRRTLAAASVTFALAGGLASCAAEPEIAPETAAAYRAQVVTIAERSAAEDFAGARAELDALQAAVDAAVAAGTLEPEREQQIRDAIALVRADLDAAIAAAVPPPTATPEPTDDNADDDDEPGNSGNGDDKGKGNDKGKGKD